MTYQAPIAQMLRTAGMLGHDRLADTALFAEATPETRTAVLEEAAKLSEEVLAPLNRGADLQGAVLENGVVRTSPGFADAYRAMAEGGWIGMIADPEHGGMGLPQSIGVMVGEMFASACLSLSLCPLLSQGQIEALERHAPDWMKALYLPRLIDGTWTGTMNLTEPQAGSDVGALRSRAEPAEDGSYRISGQKIWISWGDHDVAENVVHLVLARLPGAPEGSRGISLFLVPKLMPDEDGRPGIANRVRVLSLEHKMGIHGSPTCVMAYEGATGWLVGEENHGLACMFTMMNNARLGVGIEGVGMAERALQAAGHFAMQRVQGRTGDGSPTIIGHADVRRMLGEMAAQTRVARAICYDCALSLDLARAGTAADERAHHARRGAFLTPIAKAFSTDTGIEVASLGIQVHGGMGYCEETGAAQYLRDARITSIYEGTNGVQAADLTGRKLTGDGGETALMLIGEAQATAEAVRTAGEVEAAQALDSAVSKAAGVTRWMLEASPRDRAAGATAYLRMLATMLGGHYLMRTALDSEAAADRTLARLWLTRQLPQAHALAQAVCAGGEDLYALDAETLTAVS